MIWSEKHVNLSAISHKIAEIMWIEGSNANSRQNVKWNVILWNAEKCFWVWIFRECEFTDSSLWLRNSIRLICHFNWLLRTPTHTKKNYLSITFHSHKYFIDRCMSLIFASFHTKVIYGHTLWIIACEEGIFASAQCPRKNG